jgi:hypothetical protein
LNQKKRSSAAVGALILVCNVVQADGATAYLPREC